MIILSHGVFDVTEKMRWEGKRDGNGGGNWEADDEAVREMIKGAVFWLRGRRGMVRKESG
jgi:hypothetical protein